MRTSNTIAYGCSSPLELVRRGGGLGAAVKDEMMMS